MYNSDKNVNIIILIILLTLLLFYPNVIILYLLILFYVLYKNRKCGTVEGFKHTVEKFTDTNPFTCNANANMNRMNSLNSFAPIGNDNNNNSFVSMNKQLMGNQTPKSLIPPIITPKSHDMNFWRKNGLVSNSMINTSSNFDRYQSGYASSNCYSNVNVNNANVNFTEKFELPEQVFIQTIEPGIYVENEIIEPINSNIGISYPPQFNKLLEFDNCGNQINKNCEKDNIGPSSVYDPRFVGYGQNERMYIEKTTGQPRYMYDDINAVKMPNYICRSNIDFLPQADKYGTIEQGNEYGNKNTSQMREIAGNAWDTNSMNFRTNMQESLMRKVNSEMWQKRAAPMRRGGGQMNLIK
jgi:hypothetical protein